MYNRFRELGVPVAITRDSDITLTREERLNTMNNTFGTSPNVIILSNHINSGGGEFSCHYKEIDWVLRYINKSDNFNDIMIIGDVYVR